MLVTKSTKGYTSRRKYVDGKGFVDSLTSSLKSITSYIAQNKDLIAMPLLGAVGNLAATGLEEGGKALPSHIMNKVSNKKKAREENFQSDDDVNAGAMTATENDNYNQGFDARRAFLFSSDPRGSFSFV